MPPKMTRRRLPDMLLEQELITQEQLRECIALHRSTGVQSAADDLRVSVTARHRTIRVERAAKVTPKEVLALCREKDVKAVDLRFLDFPGLW